MAFQFIPETGEGIPGANSYLTIEQFYDYSDLYGYDYSSIDLQDIERKLIRSSSFLDAEFRFRYPGDRKKNQGLEWPREDAQYIDGEEIPEDVIPPEVQTAVVEMFYIVNQGVSIQPNISAEGRVVMERVKADVIEEEKRYIAGGSRFARDTYTAVEDALSRITGGLASLYDLKIERVGGFT